MRSEKGEVRCLKGDVGGEKGEFEGRSEREKLKVEVRCLKGEVRCLKGDVGGEKGKIEGRSEIKIFD